MSDFDLGKHAAPPPALLLNGFHSPDHPGPLGPSDSLDTIDSETRHYRHDGWTPKARADFLDKLAVSGIVTDACKEVKRSAQSAYALRNRDFIFAAGWDAALSMARARLTDELLHRSINGTVEQIWKDGAIVAEKHRHDSRLSIAMLGRLDARSDRAERIGAPSLRAAANWGAYLAALAEDRIADAKALLDAPPDASETAILGQGSESMLIHQLHQLRLGKALDEEPDCRADEGDDDRVWSQNGSWRTNFPPPDGFLGDEYGDYGDEDYHRQCTPEEREVLDRRFPDAFVDEGEELRRADENERIAFFAEPAEPSGSSPTASGGGGSLPEEAMVEGYGVAEGNPSPS